MKLTHNQANIVSLLCQGFTQKEIAFKLQVTPASIQTALVDARRKHKARTTCHLLAMFCHGSHLAA